MRLWQRSDDMLLFRIENIHSFSQDRNLFIDLVGDSGMIPDYIKFGKVRQRVLGDRQTRYGGSLRIVAIEIFEHLFESCIGRNIFNDNET